MKFISDSGGLVVWLMVITLLAAHPSSARFFQQLADPPSCGYQACQAGIEGLINVHLVPHTHDDVGWLKTVDQYYYGARNNIQHAGVQYIIDSVIDELQMDPTRRFIYVEMAFFTMWWQEQDEARRNIVKDLVSRGQLEFINGGWCMNDEATTHYADIIDQMALGLNILNDTFGECGRPRISWQIDPFGHSREQAFLFAQMGYDGLFFGRLDHEDKAQRMANKNMEMVWSTSNSITGNDGKLFTGVNYNLYQAPSGFCFDVLCDDQPIIDDSHSRDFNVEQRVTDFLNYCQKQNDVYGTDHILLTMGGDFTFMDANMWYKNMDKLIKYANERQASGSKFNLFYSTPSCYVKALNEKQRSWPSKTDDFFPYGSDAHSYWTGYFTSRPTLKYMVRQGSNLLQSCKQMASLLSMKGVSIDGDVTLMKEAIAIMQHHDAVSGTEKQHVAEDYARLVHQGVSECQKTQHSYYQNELPVGAEPLPQVFSCNLNASQCDSTEQNPQFVINVYNSLSREIDKYIRVPVPTGSAYQVLDPDGNVLISQLVPIADFIKSLPERQKTSIAENELVFLASKLPPAGSKSYYVRKTAKGHRRHFKSKSQFKNRQGRADNTITSDRLSVTVNGDTGLLSSIKTASGTTHDVTQEFMWYEGFPGDSYTAEKRSSGAYIFRPNGTAYPISSSTPPAAVTAVYTGPLVQEIHQTYDTWVNQIIRIYNGQDHVEFDWVVGPIPVEDQVGKEIINRFSTSVSSDDLFYTDANGRQSMERRLDHRNDYTYTATEPVAGNYYPINSHIFIKEKKEGGNQATLMVDRSQGGTSLSSGQMEAMVHRRLLRDDAFGVEEPLNETAFNQGLVARGTHFFLIEPTATSAQKYRTLNQEIYRQPIISFIPTTLTFEQWKAQFNMQTRIINTEALPANVNLLTVENRPDGSFLIRLEHIYNVGEDTTLSTPATVSLDNLFLGFVVTSAKETMLGGNQWKEDSDRLIWSLQKDENQSNNKAIRALVVELSPMEIRTFVITVAPE